MRRQGCRRIRREAKRAWLFSEKLAPIHVIDIGG
jgi:hypothetical protein